MKLFNAIAATAAVLGASFIAPNPAEARNGWVFTGTFTRDNGQTESVYERLLGCNGAVCTYQRQMSHWDSPSTNKINCQKWVHVDDNRTTEDIFPGSYGESTAKRICP